MAHRGEGAFVRRWFWRAVLAAVLIAFGAWLWSVVFPGPERVIRKRLAELAKSASFGGNESPLAALDNSQRVAGFFTEDIEVRMDLPGRSAQSLSGREQLFYVAKQTRSMLAGLQVEFLDVNVAVGPDKQSAQVNLTLKGRVAGEKDLIVQELKLIMNKLEGKWKIKRVETVKTLSSYD